MWCSSRTLGTNVTWKQVKRSGSSSISIHIWCLWLGKNPMRSRKLSASSGMWRHAQTYSWRSQCPLCGSDYDYYHKNSYHQNESEITVYSTTLNGAELLKIIVYDLGQTNQTAHKQGIYPFRFTHLYHLLLIIKISVHGFHHKVCFISYVSALEMRNFFLSFLPISTVLWNSKRQLKGSLNPIFIFPETTSLSKSMKARLLLPKSIITP